MTRLTMILPLAAVLAASAPTLVRANDSSVSLGIGGLEFTRTDAVAMISEDLHISPVEVYVRYVMRNLTEAPVTLTVGFPLPPLANFSDDFNPSIPEPKQANFVGFTTHVDGEEIALTPHVQALVDGQDHAALLQELGVSPVPMWSATIQAIEALSPVDLARLRDAGLIGPEGLSPRWEVRATFLRDQTFPVGRDVVIEHRYDPIDAYSLGPNLYPTFDTSTMAEWQQPISARYCWDEAMAARAERLARGIPEIEPEVTYFSSEIDYILTTGRNWAGPIGRFSLLVEGESEADMVSVCMPGINYVSQSRAEFDAENFVPESDLAVYILLAIPGPMPE